MQRWKYIIRRFLLRIMIVSMTILGAQYKKTTRMFKLLALCFDTAVRMVAKTVCSNRMKNFAWKEYQYMNKRASLIMQQMLK